MRTIESAFRSSNLCFDANFTISSLGRFVDEPLINPRDHYRCLRAGWALSRQKKLPRAVCSSFLDHPFARQFEPSKAIVHLLLYPNHFNEERLDGSLVSLLDSGLMLCEMAQLAFLWVLQGDIKPAEHLIKQLFVLFKHPTLWTLEAVYDLEEFENSIALLYSYLGLAEKSRALHPVDPFFLALKEALCGHSCSFTPVEHFYDSAIGVWVNPSSSVSLSGYGTSLATFRSHEVEICAFGPQFYPLTNIDLFGVQGIHQAQSMDDLHICGWTCCFGQKDVWLQTAVCLEHSQWQIDLRWAGLSPTKKTYIVFYVKAKSAHIANQVFFSKSLQRYTALAQSVYFNNREFMIASSDVRPVELVPLAGQGCFWDADFLLAFEMNPFDPLGHFTLGVP
ncbi:MAG: hypothetical protein K2X08_05920 [Chlamydiales bacterium]|nr:hypothetical protein [Chlamydiales bacterium]